jgi:serine/threonine-protein kinase
VGPAQAAAAGAGHPAGVLHTAACKVRYRVEKDTGTDFEARLTVVNTGDRALEDWRMEFVFPGSQRLTDPARPVAQNGRKVILRGQADLHAGRAVTVTLRGAYRGSNPLPLTFKLDGRSCHAEVLGATTVTAGEGGTPAEPAVAERDSGPGRAGAGRPERNRDRPVPAREPRPETRTDDRTPPSPTRPPVVPGGRSGGFSVAV